MCDSKAVIAVGAEVAATAQLGDYVVVYPGAQLADETTVLGLAQIWSGVRLLRGAKLGPGVSLENNDTTAPRCIIFGSNCFVGANSTICQGVEIGEGAVVKAGSVVCQSVPPYAIVAGVPARIVGYVENFSPERVGLRHVQGNFPAVQGEIRLGVGDVTLHRLKLVIDPRGNLTVGEFLNDIPFQPKRYFLVFSVPNEKTRGEHAHHKCMQFLICVRGSCAVVVDDGKKRCEVLLESPDTGIYLPPLTWGTQYKYSPDAVLLVFTSEFYDADDYIREYSSFIRIASSAVQ